MTYKFLFKIYPQDGCFVFGFDFLDKISLSISAGIFLKWFL